MATRSTAPEVAIMFNECRRLSDQSLLLSENQRHRELRRSLAAIPGYLDAQRNTVSSNTPKDAHSSCGIRHWTVYRVRDGGKRSGETLVLAPGDRPELRMTLDWTFPLQFAEITSGDGTKVRRQRIDLTETGSFGERTLTLAPNLQGQKWVRVAAWDIAANGSFTQPLWLAGPTEAGQPR